MNNMLDREEIDNLFKDKLMDAAIAPTTNLWAGIEKQLEQKPKRSFPIFWLAAASVVIAIAGVFMLQQQETLYLRHQSLAVTPVPKIDEAPVMVDAQPLKKLVKSYSLKSLRSENRILDVNNTQNEVVANLKDTMRLQPSVEIARLPVKPANEKLLAIVTEKVESVETDIASINQEQELPENEKRKGIRNVGDLVNYVVDKVDNRAQKFLKFNTDEDENSSLEGVNIGFLRLNKKTK